jgi:site-specific DNA-methyltransferase (adenine-specific)
MADPAPARRTRRAPTATSAFGVGRREGHDASGFYQRFAAPVVSVDDTVAGPVAIDDAFVCGDSRRMDRIPDRSVALVVTSPPYFAGKQYEVELERDGIPSSYLEYLAMLRDVFADCVRTLEPGGRIAVNVANLGRKPYRSLAADVIRILQDDLGLLLRGEIVWQKGEGASGSCAWGSFRSPANPVLRDVTERVVVASKGRFDRALSVGERRRRGLPSRATVSTDDFLALTLDVWSMPAESARRVGHPAPFPVELPEQLIRLYTYEGDLVLDPFMGSGSTLVAAARTGRRYVGYDLDPAYVAIARERVTAVEPAAAAGTAAEDPATGHPDAAGADEAIAVLAERALVAAGFTDVRAKQRLRGTGITMPFTALDASGRRWCFDLGGANTSHRAGLTRTDVAWRAVGRAVAARPSLDALDPPGRMVLLTTRLPARGSDADAAIRAAGHDVLADVIDLLDPDALARLGTYAAAAGTGATSSRLRNRAARS